MKLRDAQIEWTPGDPKALIVFERRFDADGRIIRPPDRYRMWTGAGRLDHRAARGWRAIARMMAYFHWVVLDGIDPRVARREFLKIDEYREFTGEVE